MTREEYMNKLAQGLKAYDKEFANDILEDYKNHFDEAIADGRSEQAVIDELGPVEDLLKDIPNEFKLGIVDQLINDFNDFTGKVSEKVNAEANKAETDKAEAQAEEKTAEPEEKPDFSWANDDPDFGKAEEEKKTSGFTMDDNTKKIIDEAAGLAGSIFSGLGKLVAGFSKEVESFVVDETAKAKKAYDEYVENNINDDYTESTFVGKYDGVETFKINVTAADVEVRQSSDEELLVELSRPLTKKEKMLYDIQVSNVNGSVKISTCSNPGRYTIGLLGGKTEPLTFYVSVPAHIKKVAVTTVSGNVCFATPVVAEKIKVETVSGSVNVEKFAIAGKVRLSSISGKVFGVIDTKNFEISSVSGAVDLQLNNSGDGKIETVSGAIKVGLLSDIGMKITSSSLSGGLKIHTDKDVRWDREGNEVNVGIGSERKAAFGNEGVVLRTESVSGTIRVYDCGFYE